MQTGMARGQDKGERRAQTGRERGANCGGMRQRAVPILRPRPGARREQEEARPFLALCNRNQQPCGMSKRRTRRSTEAERVDPDARTGARGSKQSTRGEAGHAARSRALRTRLASLSKTDLPCPCGTHRRDVSTAADSETTRDGARRVLASSRSARGGSLHRGASLRLARCAPSPKRSRADHA